MKRWDLARRDLLAQLGVGAACLPLLHASRVWGADAAAPKRLLILQLTNGYRQAAWRPPVGSLLSQPLPEASSPLEPHKAQLVFLPGMTHPSYPGQGIHGAYGTVFAGGPNSGSGEYRVPYTATVDQVVGQALAKAHNLARVSLPLQIQVDKGGLGAIGSRRCFWRGRDEPINPEANPYQTYRELFAGLPAGGGAGSDDAARRLVAHQKSILDYVGRSLERFKSRLGPEDRAGIEGHTVSIRELEKQLAPPRSAPGQCGTDPGAPLDHNNNANYPQLVKVALDLAVAALRCDVTRVATIQCGNASSNLINFGFVPGVPQNGTGYQTPYRNWHDLGHNPVMNGVDHKRLVDRWWMGQAAELISRLKAIAEPGGTMFDGTVVLVANIMEEGANHDTQKIPFLLAGSGRGYLRTGQCAPSAGKPLNGALAQICNAMGVPVEFFGNASYGAPMAELKA